MQGGWNKNKYNKTGINEAKRRLAPLKTQLRSLKADIALLQQCVQVRIKEEIFLDAQIFLNRTVRPLLMTRTGRRCAWSLPGSGGGRGCRRTGRPPASPRTPSGPPRSTSTCRCVAMKTRSITYYDSVFTRTGAGPSP